MEKNLILKRKHRKLISALWRSIKKVDDTLVDTILKMVNPGVIGVTEEEFEEFKESLNEADLLAFLDYDSKKQKSVIALSKKKFNNTKDMVTIADKLISNYDDIDEELDAIVMASSGLTLAELDEMTIPAFGKLVVEVVQANVNFSITPESKEEKS